MGKTRIKSNPPETIKSLNPDRNQFEIPFKLNVDQLQLNPYPR